MNVLLFSLGFFGLIIGLVLIILRFVKKKKMHGGIVLGISFLLCVLGFVLTSTDPVDEPQKDTVVTNASTEKSEAEIEEERKRIKAEYEQKQAANASKGKVNNISTEEVSLEIEAVKNAEKHPAKPGAILYGPDLQGEPYHFKGNIIGKGEMEGLGGATQEAWLVKNDNGYVMPIFPLMILDVNEGDVIEVWGNLSGDGYANADLGVDNVVGMTGAINAMFININGVRQ